MKSVKHLVFGLLLVVATTVSVSAGEMPIPPVEPPPGATATTQGAGTETPLVPMSEQSGETVETSDYLLFEALAALLSVY